MSHQHPKVTITEVPEAYRFLLTSEVIDFLVALHEKFEPRRKEILKRRKERDEKLQQGIYPDFLPETENVRKGNWKIAGIPKDLLDRRVEITGPVDRKMIINALNSGANVFMADFEDSTTPTWHNVLSGQHNLYDAVRKTITFFDEAKNKKYELNSKIATLFVRPRGWHLDEKNVLVNGERMSGGVFDFAIFLYHNAKYLLEHGSGPYFYLPKTESHLEARLWNDIFVFAQDYIKIPQGSIKVTVLIETIMASFELEEILYELRNHIVGLNCGRWDYIFSYIKKFRKDKNCVLPDRAEVTMTVPFMKNYTELVIQTCHKRGAFAMGGMSAFIPINNNPEANEIAIGKVRDDKEREAKAGHDGTWVAHPGLVSVAKEQFDKYMPTPNQLHNLRQDVKVIATDLLTPSKGKITRQGFKMNIDIALQYLESWLRGMGCVPIYNMMEDAATAEISRAQLWQWVYHQVKLEDGTLVTEQLFKDILAEVLADFKNNPVMNFDKKKFNEAAKILEKLVLTKNFEEFLTLSAYEQV